MHIVYDSQIFSLQEVGGISRYFQELAQRLPVCSPATEATILAPLHVSRALHHCQVRVIGRKITPFPGKHRILPFVNRLASQWALKALQPDILHETYYSAAPLSVSVPRLLTVYDMIHERFPHQFTGVDCAIAEMKAKAVTRADHIIAISQSTRDDLVAYLHVDPLKITVVPLASSIIAPEDKSQPPLHVKPYLLYVGVREGVKNFQTLLSAFGHSSLLRREFDLLCVGGGELTMAECHQIRDFGLQDNIRQLAADDTLLARLYADAALFVYPSLYEGFGLPLLEAMRCGCPVACSNTGSMPEIAGDAALYFDPLREDEMQMVIKEIVQSEALAASLRIRGYEREKLFSWEQCAQQTAVVYRRVLDNARGH